MRAAIGTGGPDDRENAAAEVFRKLAASEPTLGRVRAGGGGSRPGEGLVLQRCEYISHAAVLRDTRPGVQIRDTECGYESVRLGFAQERQRPLGDDNPSAARHAGLLHAALATLILPEVGSQV